MVPPQWGTVNPLLGGKLITKKEEVTMPSSTRRKEPDKTTVEVMVRDVVYEAALARARSQAQQLRAVAREILFEAAAQVDPNGDRGYATARVLGQPPRMRLRFRAPADAYTVARERLRRAGVSVTAAVEDGLAHYARTGTFK
jgi:hypothetical protein